MSIIWIVVLAAVVVLGVLVLGAVLLLRWHGDDPDRKALVKRIGGLPFRAKGRLAIALARDGRIPLRVRIIPPLLILYLANPIDLIPDFVPLVGYLDDVLIVALGIGLLLRFTPRAVLEEHIRRLEPIDREPTH